MKRIFFFIIIMVSSFLMSVTVYGGYFTYSPEETTSAQDYFSDLSKAIPEDIKEKLGDTDKIFSESQTSSDSSVISAVLDTLTESLSKGITSASGTLAVSLAVIILSAVLKSVTEEKSGRYYFLIRCIISLSVTEMASGSLLSLSENAQRLCTVCEGFVPILTSLSVSSVGMTVAALTKTGYAVILTLTERIMSAVSIPCVSSALALSVISYVTMQRSTDALGRSLRTFAAIFTAGAMTVFTFIFNMRMKLGESADRAAMKVARFAVGNLVPVVGGTLSESAGQIVSSVSLIKSACGTVMIAVIVILTLPQIISLLCQRTVIFILTHVSDTVDSEIGGSFLSEIGSIFTLMLIVSVSVSVMFIFCIAGFVSITSA